MLDPMQTLLKELVGNQISPFFGGLENFIKFATFGGFFYFSKSFYKIVKGFNDEEWTKYNCTLKGVLKDIKKRKGQL